VHEKIFSGHLIIALSVHIKLQDFKSCVEVLFSRLERVSSLEASFLQDYEECQRAIEDIHIVINDNLSFLSNIFDKFIENTEIVLESFLVSVRAKYNAKVVKAWGNEIYIQKRYPMHEPSREFNVSVPLRNEGTGLAMDVGW
jgi:hypothetical protein